MSRLQPIPLHIRHQAFELWCQNVPAVDIAAKLGVSRQVIGRWADKERWRARRLSMQNPDQVDPTGDLGPTMVQFRHGLQRRVQELEDICTGRRKASTAQLSGIRLWFQLAASQFRHDEKKPPPALEVLSMENDLPITPELEDPA